jgi:hypothetical protein
MPAFDAARLSDAALGARAPPQAVRPSAPPPLPCPAGAGKCVRSAPAPPHRALLDLDPEHGFKRRAQFKRHVLRRPSLERSAARLRASTRSRSSRCTSSSCGRRFRCCRFPSRLSGRVRSTASRCRRISIGWALATRSAARVCPRSAGHAGSPPKGCPSVCGSSADRRPALAQAFEQATQLARKRPLIAGD